VVVRKSALSTCVVGLREDSTRSLKHLLVLLGVVLEGRRREKRNDEVRTMDGRGSRGSE
jgi:hypothetical protein